MQKVLGVLTSKTISPVISWGFSPGSSNNFMGNIKRMSSGLPTMVKHNQSSNRLFWQFKRFSKSDKT